MALTTLSQILDRMNRYPVISKIEEQYLVRDLDEAIRGQRREIVFPWNIKKTTLRVFKDVLEYPVASDHDELVLLDNSEKQFARRAQFRFTSLSQFYEDPDYRNDLADIWDQGTKFLGVRYRPLSLSSVMLDSAEVAANASASGTASDPVLDNVVFKEGNGSIRYNVTAGTATMKMAFGSSVNDANYKRKYHLSWYILLLFQHQSACDFTLTLQITWKPQESQHSFLARH